MSTNVRQAIDQRLDYLTEAWCGLPRAEREIDQWDLIDLMDYVEEWTPKEDLAADLRRLIASPDATEEQQRRYERLERLMRANRPILDRWRAS